MDAAIVGVIGTILGTILGWFLNSLSNKGKLKLYITSWEDDFQYLDEIGCAVPSNSIEQTEFYSYKLSLDIYNSSGEQKIMRNIAIIFNDGKSDLYKSIPQDIGSRRISGSVAVYDNVLPLNIPPKTVVHIELLNTNHGHELDYIWNTKRIGLTYTDTKGKDKRVIIKSEDYAKYFNKCSLKNS